MKKTTYAELLKDPRWQKKRLKLLSKANFQCDECGDEKSSLHVHHKRYDSGSKPWEYEDLVFIVLCESCHSHRHKLETQIKDLMTIMDCSCLEMAIGYMIGISGDAGFDRHWLPMEGIFGLSDAISMHVQDIADNVSKDNFISLKKLRKVRKKK